MSIRVKHTFEIFAQRIENHSSANSALPFQRTTSCVETAKCCTFRLEKWLFCTVKCTHIKIYLHEKLPWQLIALSIEFCLYMFNKKKLGELHLHMVHLISNYWTQIWHWACFFLTINIANYNSNNCNSNTTQSEDVARFRIIFHYYCIEKNAYGKYTTCNKLDWNTTLLHYSAQFTCTGTQLKS